MGTIENALDQIITGKLKESYIACEDAKNQESVRTMTFRRRAKLPTALKDTIAISKVTDEGNLFVKVYLKPTTSLYVKDPVSGKLVPYKAPFDPESDPALQRQLKLMREDGASKEELDKVIEEAKREWLGK